jgi:arsenate reductase (thioredoxin)
MSAKPYNVLFLCTGNSARSIMAEALLNTIGKGRFRAYSAGSHPTGKVNPFALEQLKGLSYRLEILRRKSWDEFAQPDAPKMDVIITICDSTAGEVCPVWPGQPMSAHWPFADPAAVEGTDEEKRRAFKKAFMEIKAPGTSTLFGRQDIVFGQRSGSVSRVWSVSHSQIAVLTSTVTIEGVKVPFAADEPRLDESSRPVPAH